MSPASPPLFASLKQLEELSDEQLLELRVGLETEMKRRGLAFSVGDIGERLAISFFNQTPGLPTLQAAPPGTKNVDAISRNGDRYSIKTIWSAKKTGTIYPDASNKNKQLFEFLVIVRLNRNMLLYSIHRLSWEQFTSIRSWDRRMSAWYVGCSEKNLSACECLIPPSPLDSDIPGA